MKEWEGAALLPDNKAKTTKEFIIRPGMSNQWVLPYIEQNTLSVQMDINLFCVKECDFCIFFTKEKCKKKKKAMSVLSHLDFVHICKSSLNVNNFNFMISGPLLVDQH